MHMLVLLWARICDARAASCMHQHRRCRGAANTGSLILELLSVAGPRTRLVAAAWGSEKQIQLSRMTGEGKLIFSRMYHLAVVLIVHLYY